MRRFAALLVLVSLLLCGCSGWMNGSYVHVSPHQDETDDTEQDYIQVRSYSQLRSALVELVGDGKEQAILSVESFDQSAVAGYMDKAIQYATDTDPIGAYAVEAITYEQGISGNLAAVAVTITYNHNQAELRAIKWVDGMEEAGELITGALSNFETGIVLRVTEYEKIDYAQLLQDFADANPELVMEVPQITVNAYPYSGYNRVLEVKLSYQSNRENLRSMQKRVQDVFDSARLYVSGDGEPVEKYAQLSSFLTERFDYQYDTSITPSYSLLCHGVGDSRAFAVVYAAMCQRSGLDCQVVSGTRAGDAWFWNIICDDGIYYHVDLIQNSGFRKLSDQEMAGYVWDYSAYPACGVAGQVTEETAAESTGETEG